MIDRNARSNISASGHSTAFGGTLLALLYDAGIRESPSSANRPQRHRQACLSLGSPFAHGTAPHSEQHLNPYAASCFTGAALVVGAAPFLSRTSSYRRMRIVDGDET